MEKKDDNDSFIIDSPKVTRKRVTKVQSRIAKDVEESSSTRKTTRTAPSSASATATATSTPSTRKTTHATASYLAPSSAVIAAAGGAATPSTRKAGATAAPSVRTYSRSAVKKAPHVQAEKENVTQQVPVPTPVIRSTARVKRI